MRRILATSIAAAIPAVLPVHAVNAYSKPAPPPAAGSHYKPTRAHRHALHAGHALHGRSAPTGETRDRGSRPENDVKVDAEDGGGRAEPESAPQANAAPEHGAAGAHGTRGTRGRTSRPARSAPGSRPGTGAESGFADADEAAMPAEATEALQEADELQNSADQATRPRAEAPQPNAPQGNPSQGNAPQDNAPQDNAPQGNAPQGNAPEGNAPQGAAPGAAPHAPHAPRAARAPRGTGRARPASPVTDQSTNQSSGRKIRRAGAPRSMPVAFFNAGPIPQGSRLVLHTSAGNGPEHTVTLQCDPPGGTHPKAAEACGDVAKAGGDLAQMPANSAPRACFMIYAPVTASAQGDWQGQSVRFTKKFPNTCVMRDKTGSVFDF
jgi:Subtilisin inhibitor-like